MDRQTLMSEQATALMQGWLEGAIAPELSGAILTALQFKGIEASELAAMANVLQSQSEGQKLKDQFGAKYFRSLRLIKNSYGSDDLRIGLGFLGQLGIFRELKKRNDMTDSDYEAVINKTYFLNK